MVIDMGINGTIAIRYTSSLNLSKLAEELKDIDPETSVEVSSESLYKSSESNELDGKWILIENLDRWFSEDYKRGYWPRIKKLIEVAQKYAKEVWYYPDERDWIEPTDLVTVERIRMLDSLYSETFGSL